MWFIMLTKFSVMFLGMFMLFGYADNARGLDTKTANNNFLATQATNSNAVHLLNINVWAPEVYKTKDLYPGKKYTDHINTNDYDFITTQEYEGRLPWGYITNRQDPNYGLNSKYKLANNSPLAFEDPNIFYDSSRWDPIKYDKINITPDDKMDGSAGTRVAVFAKFRSKGDATFTILVASAHYCVNWGQSPWGSRGCKGSSMSQAHLNDSIAIANKTKELIKNDNGGDASVIFTGDFNSLGDWLSQANQIKNALAPYLIPVLSGNSFIGPTFPAGNANQTIDFVYYNGLNVANAKLYTKNGDGNPSDHEGIDVLFSRGNPTPPITCDAPTTSYLYYAASNLVTISLDRSTASDSSAIELWPWNKTQGQMLASTTEKTLTYNSAPLGNPGPDNSYLFYARNKCTGNGNYSDFQEIKFYRLPTNTQN